MIERDLGLLPAAAARLLEVREGFRARPAGRMADVSLDLAEIYLELVRQLERLQ